MLYLFSLYNWFFLDLISGSIAIPGACIGIFMGGCLVKRLDLRPKGAVKFVLISNFICLLCYGLLFFLGCDNVKMAGTTIPYYNKWVLTNIIITYITKTSNFIKIYEVFDAELLI